MKITVTHEIEVDQGLAARMFGVDRREVEADLRALATEGVRLSVRGKFGFGSATITRVALSGQGGRPGTLADRAPRLWDGGPPVAVPDAEDEPLLREE